MVCRMEYRSMVCRYDVSVPPAEVDLPAIEFLREFACVEGQQNREDRGNSGKTNFIRNARPQITLLLICSTLSGLILMVCRGDA